jgi:hypothetical protein
VAHQINKQGDTTMPEPKLIAFHGDAAIKTKYVERVKAHQAADEITQGFYWENGKGCAVGCTIEGSQHARYETELGIPRIIARLEDRIFEGLTDEEAKKFPLKFLQAIKPGANLSMVWPKFVVWLLSDEKDGVTKFAKTERTRNSITAVTELYKRRLRGDEPTYDEWHADAAADAAYAAADAAAADAADAADAAAAAAAYAAAAYAAADAAAAAAAYAADAAAAAYAADAAAAAYAAADAAYAAAARHKHFKKMADKLLELLKEAE